MKTACVEKSARLGGVCLNAGCIPSKALLDSSEFFRLARTGLAEHGVKTGKVSLDLAAMMARKDKVVADLTANVARLLADSKVDVIQGAAQLAGHGRIVVTGPDGKTDDLKAKAIVLATGSRPVELPLLPFDGQGIISSTEALALAAVPQSLGIVGGGYIGLELGSVWQRLGARVTVIEALPHIAAGLDGQIRRALDRILRGQSMAIVTGSRVIKARSGSGQVEVEVEAQGQTTPLVFERVLVAVGRKPLTAGLNVEAAGVKTDPATGHILVNPGFQTSVEGIYAIGDLIAGPMLAHKASAEGTAVAELLAGNHAEVNYDAIPAVVYTHPEVAWVGLTEEQARARQIPCCTAVYPFAGNGRARCMGATEGMVKVVVHAQTDRLLGAHIIGARAADMIAECVLALEFGASSEDIARTVHGHPTFAEALQEAARGARACSLYA
jgi:dihydrolipoamide dehydrogenase